MDRDIEDEDPLVVFAPEFEVEDEVLILTHETSSETVSWEARSVQLLHTFTKHR
ncbi:hypothetical protein GCM10025770_20050 [Viridibacterium curvum]|uniref:Uncharacterized protein n=2 Tax=Viridibacterium curvum TaxID=1101404 RepID=A0ABP9QP79_9RHOO